MVVHGPYPVGETRVEREARAAVDAGFDVDVVAMHNSGEPAQETTDEGIQIFRLPLSRERGASFGVVVREYLGFALRSTREVAKLHRQRRYGVVQIHNPPDFLIIAGLIPKLRGARLVLDIHDFAPELFAMRFSGRRGAGTADFVLWRVESLATHLADKVVTVHEPYRRLLAERGVPDEKVIVALNSPDERLLPPAVALETSERFRIVYHGTVTPHYGLETLVDAFALVSPELPTSAVEIYGAGDALAQVQARAVERGVADRIAFSDGFLESDDILRTIRGANVGVVANLGVARNAAVLPTKLLEYVALGVPVVSSDLAGVREHFDDSEMLFYEAGDANALADALLMVARDPDAAVDRAERARSRYESSYRWEISAKRYVEMLEELLG